MESANAVLYMYVDSSLNSSHNNKLKFSHDFVHFIRFIALSQICIMGTSFQTQCRRMKICMPLQIRTFYVERAQSIIHF